jgi:hypothetical protein
MSEGPPGPNPMKSENIASFSFNGKRFPTRLNQPLQGSGELREENLMG